jgi:hypothetical protein
LLILIWPVPSLLAGRQTAEDHVQYDHRPEEACRQTGHRSFVKLSVSNWS